MVISFWFAFEVGFGWGGFWLRFLVIIVVCCD